jgi:hypothetical protein
MGPQARLFSSPVYGGGVSGADGGGIAPLGPSGHSPRKQGEKTGEIS